MNKVILCGNLTKDLELKHTNNGTELVSFTLAVRRKADITDFLPVTVWRHNAKFLADYARKGDKVTVAGILISRNYEDKNGNKCTAYQVWGDDVELMSRRADASERNPRSTADEFDPLDEFDEVDSDNELPF